MNSYMNIMIRVGSAKAQAQLAAMSAQMKGLRVETMAMNRTVPFGAASFSNLIKFGSRLQWVGRQLQYNFTLPLLLAGGAAVKFSLDQEKAFTHVAKVYGSVSDAQKFFRKTSDGAMTAMQAHTEAIKAQRNELAALDDAFTAISDHYGVQKKDVDEVAGAWAAAGASGERLAKSVNLTMQAMIIGDMDATTATQSLISIQAQYNLNSKQLASTLAMLNNVENQTGISMSGLIEGFTRAAGVARSAGVSTKELAAELAALVPATGSAASAGNALKTIYSRLMAPTQDSMDVMKAMGLQIEKTAWQSANGADRLKLMQGAFEKLGSSAKVVAASVIASRWQVNKFEVLMDELGKKTGFYSAALKAAGNETNNFKVMQSELNTVLKSNPRSLQRMGVILQNASVKIIQPLIPFIIYLAQEVGKLAQAFANLDPHVQKLILLGAVFLALIGPLVRYLGALKILVGVVGVSVSYLGGAFLFLSKMMIGLPFAFVRKGFVLLGTMMMSILPTSVFAVGESMSIWGGLATFFAAWQGLVNRIFAVGNILRLKIWVTGLLAQIEATRAWAALQLLSFKVFWLKLKLLFIAGTLEGMGTWAAMWSVLKGITIAGMASQFLLFRKAMGIVAIFKVLGGALVVAWRATWALLEVISAAGWALLRAQWIAQSIIGVGIFARMRAALVVIWTTTAAASATIWRGMALTMVAFSRAGVIGVIGVFKALIPFMLKFGKFLLGPWGAIIAIVTTLILAFHNQIIQIFRNIYNYLRQNLGGVGRLFGDLGGLIMKVFNMLPQGIQNAMKAVVQIVHDAAVAVYNLFSYINPFAHHSPSLVENVQSGMLAVMKSFSMLRGVKSYTDAAYKEISRFGKLTAKFNMNATVQDQKATRHDLKKAGVSPATLGSYDRLNKILNALTPIADRLNAAMSKQQRIVDALQAKLDKYNTKLQAAQDALNYYASAPLKGMQAMDDQIEANTVAQNKLKLAMMNMEDATGPLDDIKSKLDAIAGTQEMLRGKRTDLALGGAGSDILSTYDSQIAALDKQKKGYQQNADALQTMQDRLDALQRAADRLDLVKALKFDDLNYQIQKAANTTKELSFADIMNGVAQAQAQIAKYGPLVDKTQKSVDKQQKALDKLTARYNKVNDAIQAINDSLNNVADSAQKANAAMASKKTKKSSAGSISPAMQAFNAAGNSSFPDPGGLGIGPRKNWKDQSAQIKKFTDNLATSTADMFAQINPFTPLVDKAKTAWSKLKEYFRKNNPFEGMGNPFKAALSGVKAPGNMGEIKKQLGDIVAFVEKVGHDIGGFLKKAWRLLGPDVKRIAKGIIHGFQDMWRQVGPELKQFKDLWKPLGKAIQNAWKVTKPVLAVMGGLFLLLMKVVTHVLAEVIGPLFHDLGNVIAAVVKVIRGALEIIIGILSGDWSLAWKGVKDLVGGVFQGIWYIIKGAVHLIWNILEGLVQGIFGFFKWLYDVLIGHSIVPDIVNGVIKWFKFWFVIPKMIWDKVIKPLWNRFVDGWNKLKDLIGKWWPWIKQALQPWYQWASIIWNKALVPLWQRIQQGFDKVRDIIGGARDRIGDILGTIRDKFSNMIDFIKGVPDRLKDFVSNFKDAGTTLISALWNGMKNAGSVIADVAGSIVKYVVGKLNAGIDVINEKIPNSIGKGKFSIDLPDAPFPHLSLFTGGVVKGSKYGVPAMIGDKGYDEAVIPLSGPYAPRWARRQDEGSFNPKSMSSVTKHQTFNFYGDLTFPEVKDGNDVDTFISNLESLAS